MWLKDVYSCVMIMVGNYLLIAFKPSTLNPEDDRGPEPHSECGSSRQPVVVFHSPPRGNLFHFLLDGALAVFPTLDARQLLDNFQVLRENRTDTDQARLQALSPKLQIFSRQKLGEKF